MSVVNGDLVVKGDVQCDGVVKVIYKDKDNIITYRPYESSPTMYSVLNNVVNSAFWLGFWYFFFKPSK
jgi:hypothetical protein